MPRRRLLYLSIYDPYTPLTGAGSRGRAFVTHLAGSFDVDLLYIEGAGQPPLSETPAAFQTRFEGVESQSVSYSNVGYFLFSRALYRKASKLLATRRYDFMLCDHSVSGIYGLLLSRRFRVPFVYSSHNVDHLAYRDRIAEDPRRLVLLPYIYAVEKYSVQRARILVCVSEKEAAFFAGWTDPAKMIVIPQGFDDEIFNPFYEPAGNADKIVLFCGNFRNSFTLEALDAVMQSVRDKVLLEFPSAKFRFVGAHPPTHIRHPNVEFTGFIEDLPFALQQADVVIAPVRRGRGMPTTVIEALACGKPTVATSVGARSIEPEYESLIICEIDEFAQAICEELRRDQPVRLGDFEKLRSRYAWKSSLPRLSDQIEAACGHDAS